MGGSERDRLKTPRGEVREREGEQTESGVVVVVLGGVDRAC